MKHVVDVDALKNAIESNGKIRIGYPSQDGKHKFVDHIEYGALILMINTLAKPAGESCQKCRECGGTNLEWSSVSHTNSGVTQGRLRTDEVQTLFFLGCNDCGETLNTLSPHEIEQMLNTINKPAGKVCPECGGNGRSDVDIPREWRNAENSVCGTCDGSGTLDPVLSVLDNLQKYIDDLAPESVVEDSENEDLAAALIIIISHINELRETRLMELKENK